MTISRRSWLGTVIGGAVAGFAAKKSTPKEVPVAPTPKVPYIASGMYYREAIEVTTHGDFEEKFVVGTLRRRQE